ncbi:hypothetical protein C1752_06373 [Acaryochloris thomasi RCC1774]|uniref:Uncharacterized protein n=1 Tax=Acaryochloris thomasi RCC1774 TaxID=1764569 RepID=A0A2W1JMX6_9CYAN|nr:hypothetical protein C1752_06373 [Acaryochloris thomasi RCC1774]
MMQTASRGELKNKNNPPFGLVLASDDELQRTIGYFQDLLEIGNEDVTQMFWIILYCLRNSLT